MKSKKLAQYLTESDKNYFQSFNMDIISSPEGT